MTNFTHFVKAHWFKILVVALLAYFALQQTSYFGMQYGSPAIMRYDMAQEMGRGGYGVMNQSSDMMSLKTSSIVPPSPGYGESVDVDATDRRVQRNASMSLLVKDIRDSLSSIESLAEGTGGFVVNSSASRPSEGGSGWISIRVPTDSLDQVLESLRNNAVQVVHESITANDVTDQYKDIDARLATLRQTKSTFEGMLAQANDVDEILKVQQAILNTQDQIDRLQGELEYLAKTSESSLIDVQLSTDELALPYSPSDPWRPNVVFKTAVRSLVLNARQLANLAIWGLVYSPILILFGIAYWFWKRRNKGV